MFSVSDLSKVDLYLQGLLTLVYLTSSDIYALINYVGFATWLSIGLSIVVLLYLRWKRPNMPRPIKVRDHIQSTCLSTICNVSLCHLFYVLRK